MTSPAAPVLPPQVELHPTSTVSPDTVFEIKGKDCRVVIGPNCRVRGKWQLLADHSYVEIGAGARMNGYPVAILSEPDTQLVFGEGCLLASSRFRTSDVHPIYDRATAQRINPPESIHIGARVWIGELAYILKGSRIGAGSIIGAQSVVTGRCDIPEYSLAVGQPARVVRRNVEWRHTPQEPFVQSPDPNGASQ